MCSPSRSWKSVAHNWSYGAFRCFCFACISPCAEFSGDISAIFCLDLKHEIDVEFIDIFLGRLGWMILISRTEFLGFGVPLFGVVDIWWLRPPKGTPSECIHFPSVSLVYRKTFSCRLCREHGKFRRFWLWLCHL